jgi:prevent-host-death family protein
MKTAIANSSKQQLGQVLDSACTEPISITKSGRPGLVLTSKEDHDSLVGLKFEQFKREVELGFDQLNRGECSDKTFEKIAAEAMAEFKKN